MNVLHLLTIGGLVWASGALFSAGWLELRRARTPHPETGLWQGSPHWGSALIWGAIAIAALWAVLVVMGEIAGSELWSITRATYWAR